MRRKRSSSGFTLVEIMMALSLLGIGLLSLAAMQITAMKYGARGRHQTKAAAIAEVQLETLMRQRWTNLTTTGGWTTAVTANESIQSGSTKIEQAYSVSWRIADVDPTRTRSVDVRVQWAEPNGPSRQFALSGLRFNHEGL
jgi:prepilin-type N-terminal cleavage/methylation domain-containing protein